LLFAATWIAAIHSYRDFGAWQEDWRWGLVWDWSLWRLRTGKQFRVPPRKSSDSRFYENLADLIYAIFIFSVRQIQGRVKTGFRQSHLRRRPPNALSTAITAAGQSPDVRMSGEDLRI
jgi:hypothetical protein